MRRSALAVVFLRKARFADFVDQRTIADLQIFSGLAAVPVVACKTLRIRLRSISRMAFLEMRFSGMVPSSLTSTGAGIVMGEAASASGGLEGDPLVVSSGRRAPQSSAQV